MRLLCPSAAMTLFVPDDKAIMPATMRGKAGQTSSVSFAGVLGVQKVADSGDVVIQEQGFSIVDTHEPEIAMPLSSLSPVCLYLMDSYSYRNQIFHVGRHQGVRRFVSIRITRPTSHHASQQSL
jgi:hypothetical protein